MSKFQDDWFVNPSEDRQGDHHPVDVELSQKFRELCTNLDPARSYKQLTLVENRSSNHGTLGQSKTYRARQVDKTGQVTIVRIAPRAQHKHTMLSYFTVLPSLLSATHPNVIKYLDVFEYRYDWWIVLDEPEGCDLLKIINSNILTEGQMAFISREITKGLEFIHGRRIIHRDVKSDLILVTATGNVLLTNFSISVQLKDGVRGISDSTGTPYWMAPEVLSKKEYSFNVDVWALGITTIEMIQGEPPYIDIETMKVIDLIKTVGVPPIAEAHRLSAPLRDFLEKTLDMDYDRRPSATQLLKHPFFKLASLRESTLPLLQAVRENRTVQR